MKRFRFRLASVVTLRGMREQRAREAFGAAMRIVTEAEEALAGVRARVAQIEDMLRAGRQQTFRPHEYAESVAAYRLELASEQKAVDAVAQARSQMEKARTAWLEARRHLQVIENLRERARRRHQVESDRAEQVALDEHASLRALRATTTSESLS